MPIGPASPCRRVCRLEGDICLGCGRLLAEIAAWPAASNPDRHAILEAARLRMAQAAGAAGQGPAARG